MSKRKRICYNAWTPEMDKVLIENYAELGGVALVPIMQEKFHCMFTKHSIFLRARKLGLRVRESKRHRIFQSGVSNAYLSDPIGTEKDTGRHILVKISDKLNKYSSMNWKQKHRLVWEEAHGPIPKGNIIIFVDRDYHNCDLSNLRCIPRKYVTMMTQGGHNYFNDGPEMIDAGIAWCDLHYAIKEMKEKENERT